MTKAPKEFARSDLKHSLKNGQPVQFRPTAYIRAPMKRRTKKVILTIYVTPETRAKVHARARVERRSVTNIVEGWIMERAQ